MIIKLNIMGSRGRPPRRDKNENMGIRRPYVDIRWPMLKLLLPLLGFSELNTGIESIWWKDGSAFYFTDEGEVRMLRRMNGGDTYV